jgi:hypothetical protein
MVDAGPHGGYVVDFFDVVGGHQHDYSLHGPPGTFALRGGRWTEPAQGTLAGENVALAEIYDDPVLGAPGYAGSYMNYRGSGFQHLTHVQRHDGGEWAAEYTHEKNPYAKLRIRVLDQPGQTVMLADARVTPVKYPQVLKYVLARRTVAEGVKLTSRFVSVLEPYAKEPLLHTVSRHELTSGTAVVAVRVDGRTDVVVQSPTDASKEFVVAGHTFAVRAQTMVATFGTDDKLERLFFTGGLSMEVDGQNYRAPARAAGRVSRIEPASGRIAVQMEQESHLTRPGATALAGQTVTFSSPAGGTAHTIATAELVGRELQLTIKDDLLVGVLRVGAVNGRTIETPTRLVFAPSYAGATALDAHFNRVGLVQRADQDRIELVAPPGEGMALPDTDIWLSSVGPGDRLVAPFVFDWQR